jgi:hypothetical protein
MTTTTRLGAASALLFSLILGVAHADTAAPDLEARRATLNQLIKEQWDYTMRNSPEWASLLGDKRYNDAGPISRKPASTPTSRPALSSSSASRRWTPPASRCRNS